MTESVLWGMGEVGEEKVEEEKKWNEYSVSLNAVYRIILFMITLVSAAIQRHNVQLN